MDMVKQFSLIVSILGACGVMDLLIYDYRHKRNPYQGVYLGVCIIAVCLSMPFAMFYYGYREYLILMVTSLLVASFVSLMWVSVVCIANGKLIYTFIPSAIFTTAIIFSFEPMVRNLP